MEECSYKLEEMSVPEIEEALRETDIVLIPIGSIEQHGPHLPIGTDTLIAIEIAKKVGEKAKVVVAPPIFYGNSVQMVDMQGTVTVKPETLSIYLADICRAFAKQGFKKIVFINGHGGNISSIDIIGNNLSKELGVAIIRIDWWTLAWEEISKILETKLMHACEGETSLMLAIKPDIVKMEKAKKDEFYWQFVNEITEGSFNLPVIYLPFEKLTKTGVMGDPLKASAEKGQKILEAVTRKIVAFLEKLGKIEGL